VLFQSQQGQYICHWSQRRSRNKLDGRLQASKHEVSDPITEKPIETKKKEVAKFIEEKSGMDFDRFCKSVLLAQGGFAAFLQASDDERSAILEQMTGSEIYSDISKKVFERQKHEKQLLDNLQLEIKGIEILSDEQLENISLALETGNKKSTEVSEQRKQVDDSIQWLKTITQLKQDIQTTETKKKETDQLITDFQPKKSLLMQLNKAKTIQLDYQNLCHFRSQEQTAKAKQHKLSDNLTDLELKANQAVERAQNQQTEHEAFIINYESQIEKINQAKVHDQAIESLKKQIAKEKNLQLESEKSLTKFQLQLKNAQIALINLEKDHEHNQHYIETHKLDASLTVEVEGIEYQITALQSQQKTYQKQLTDVKKLNQNIDVLSKQIDEKKSNITTQIFKINQLVNVVNGINEKVNNELSGHTLEQLEERLEHKQTELQLRQKIINLEQEREQLSDGKPCPLCGALDHPYAQGNIPEMDTIQKECNEIKKTIKVVRQYQKDITQQEKELTQEKQALQKLENNIELLLKEKEGFHNQLTEYQQKLDDGKTDIQQLFESLQNKLEKYQFNITEDTDLINCLKQLKDRQIEFKNADDALSVFETKKAKLNQDISFLNKDIDTQKTKSIAYQEEIKNCQDERDTEIEKRYALVGDQKLDMYKSSLQKQLNQHNQTVEKYKQQQTEAEKALSNCQTQIKDVQQTIAEITPKLTSSESHFLAQLKEQAFENEAVFLELNEQMHQKEGLEKKHHTLLQNQRDSEQQIIQLNQKLTDLIAEDKTTEPLDKLQQTSSELEVLYQQISEQIGAYKKQLNDHQKAQDKLKEKLEKINQQTEVMQKWVNLNELIGSADGKKYRNFAQGLTFELMVNHANQQLEKMTDRYLLTRDQASPLQLCVIDNYQAGEIRTTKNLSGGETFIVSLALALGLSKMASQKIKVDSLFLDEGFGTLDEEALDMALDTLASLQEDGKIIGIISHVSALKERISTQIQVTPISGGRSQLSGAGCY
jgi:exonuclease SbcC